MDVEKLIERLHKEAYGSDIEELLLEAATAIETLRAENVKLQYEAERQRRSADDMRHLCENAERAYTKAQADLAAIEDILGDEYNLERLRKLVEADREERFVVLPAKTVFELIWCAGEGCDMVCPVSIDGKGCCDFCDHGTIVVEEVPCRQEHIERIGVDVFLTRTEAMAALRREQDG